MSWFGKKSEYVRLRELDIAVEARAEARVDNLSQWSISYVTQCHASGNPGKPLSIDDILVDAAKVFMFITDGEVPVKPEAPAATVTPLRAVDTPQS